MRIGCIIATLALSAPLVRAQQVVPVELRAAVLVRALGYERGVRAGEGSLRLLVVGDGASRADADAMARAFRAFGASTSIGGRPLRVARAATTAPGAVAELDPDVVYLANGMPPAIAREIARTLPPGRVTLCGDPRLMGAGCALGVEVASNRPRLLVDMMTARRRGMDLDTRLLRLARVVRGR